MSSKSNSSWQVVIGLEIHAQIKSNSKLFSGASTKFGSKPNQQVSLVDAGFPGVLPVINSYCVEQAVKTGLALQGEINLFSKFDRKNYFYPDLPSGYQITQSALPIIGPAYLDIEKSNGEEHRIRIHHIHLEQDAGKSIHDQHPTKSLIDLNRSGVALMEIVTEPDMKSAEEAVLFFKEIRALLRFIDTCDGNMEEGSMRADVNISVNKEGEPLGTRAEIKNLNSVKFIQQAIEYETSRQISLLEKGEKIVQETRLFNFKTGITKTMREKEDSPDYRYFPDPDLPPLIITQDFVDKIQKTIPELPNAKKLRFIEDYKLDKSEAFIISRDLTLSNFFEEALKSSTYYKKDNSFNHAESFGSWIVGEYFSVLNKLSITINDSLLSAKKFAFLVDSVLEDKISRLAAKEILLELVQYNKDPLTIIEEKGLLQISDDQFIRDTALKILKENNDKVKQFHDGKHKLLGFFIGQVMQSTKGKANPKLANKIIQEELSKLAS